MLEIILTLAVLASTTLTILLLLWPSRYVNHSPPKVVSSASAVDEPKISVQVLVLGDIGRSPRMQYHAMSIAKHGGRVDVIGYQGKNSHINMYFQANLYRINPPSRSPRQTLDYNRPLTSPTTNPALEIPPLHPRRTPQSHLANLESLPNPQLPHKACTMASRPKSALDTHPFHRNHNMFPPKYALDNRLA